MSPCNACQACLMPFAKDTGKRESENYCSYCFKDGTFCYAGDRKGFQKMCYKAMRKNGIGYIKAHFFAFMIRFAPHWRKKNA